jgi:hypothetical protein
MTQKKNTARKMWTIVAIENREGTGITESVEAPSPQAAMVLFAENRVAKCQDDPDSVEIVDVFEGEHTSKMESCSTVLLSDLLGN